MTRELTEYRLGDICRLIKGSYSSTKTPPGDYPLVVTAAQRRTALTHDLHGPAVCIPLISSTGHGDAAIHRLHFQDGPFALANLLLALLPHKEGPADAEYLYWYLTAKKDEVLVPLMRGTANVSLKEKDVANVVVPLPPLPEQQRIVNRIKSMLEKVEEAHRLSAEVLSNLSALAWSIHNATPTEYVAMRELVSLRAPDVHVDPSENYDFAGVYSFGRGVFSGQSKLGADFAYPKLTRLRAGDFTYPKLMAWEGALGVVPDECDGLVVSTEFPVFTIDSAKVLPEVLDSHFKNPAVWPVIAGDSTGTNVRRRRLNPSDFLAYGFPLPDKTTQEKIAAAWRTRASLIGQPMQRAELTALPASILARAFAGEL